MRRGSDIGLRKICPSSSDVGDVSKLASGMVVAVRIRPLSKHEIELGIQSCCQRLENSDIVVIQKNGDANGYLRSQMGTVNEYAFDAAFDENSSQYDVYNGTAKPFVPNVLAGLNVTVFAYGATGAGKTHTMLGNTRADEASQNAEAGIIPHTVSDLFAQVESKRKHMEQQGSSYNIHMSFIEVYNEQVYDLLDSSRRVLSLREDQERGVVHVAGVIEQSVTNFHAVMELLHAGNRNRTTESTNANCVSSRSHAVLQLTVRCVRRENGRESVVESKLSLIDLAGSERASATNNRGARLQEGANINKSLLALANCINALVSNSSSSGKKSNVKYRDSKLTHLLKSSLEGNCNLIMIANINPSDATYEDSHNTLKYANRAKNIKVNPLMKESTKESTWVEREALLKEENSKLRLRNKALEEMVTSLGGHIEIGDESNSASVGNRRQSVKRTVEHLSSQAHFEDHNDNDAQSPCKRANTKEKERRVELSSFSLSDSVLLRGLSDCDDEDNKTKLKDIVPNTNVVSIACRNIEQDTVLHSEDVVLVLEDAAPSKPPLARKSRDSFIPMAPSTRRRSTSAAADAQPRVVPTAVEGTQSEKEKDAISSRTRRKSIVAEDSNASRIPISHHGANNADHSGNAVVPISAPDAVAIMPNTTATNSKTRRNSMAAVAALLSSMTGDPVADKENCVAHSSNVQQANSSNEVLQYKVIPCLSLINEASSSTSSAATGAAPLPSRLKKASSASSGLLSGLMNRVSARRQSVAVAALPNSVVTPTKQRIANNINHGKVNPAAALKIAPEISVASSVQYMDI